MLRDTVAEILDSGLSIGEMRDKIYNLYIDWFKSELDKLTVISWERIRMTLQEHDKIDQHDNMFRLESIAEAQLQHDKDIINKLLE